MSLSSSLRRRVAITALAIVGIHLLTQAAHAGGLPRPAANSPQEGQPWRRAAEPLRLDPPAAAKTPRHR